MTVYKIMIGVGILMSALNLTFAIIWWMDGRYIMALVGLLLACYWCLTALYDNDKRKAL